MDDDQFQGNMSVQGGNPDPIGDTSPADDAGASTFVLGEAEKTASEVDAAGVVEATADTGEEKEPEVQSEMSRRMDEILGSFDDGIATAGAISSGNGKIIQGTAVRADAPKPDFAQAPAAAPVQAEVTTATEGVYDTNAAPVEPVSPEAPQATEPVATPVEPVAPVAPVTAPVAPMEAPTATPSLTGVPRSNIEQAAAEQAARDAVAAEEGKKIDPKILLGIIICILIIIGSGVVIFIKLSTPKGPRVSPAPVQGEPEPEPDVEEETTQRIGTAEHGYVDVPSDWARLVEGATGSEFAYADEEKENKIILNSAPISESMTARIFANGQFSEATAAGVNQPQMSEMKVSNYDAFQVFYYSNDTEQWTFKFIFEAEDQRVHYIQVIVKDNTSALVNSVPESWSLNQNETKKEETENTEGDVSETESVDKTETGTDDDVEEEDESGVESED